MTGIVEAAPRTAADNLRADSRKSSSEYCMPVPGVIFRRHAANRRLQPPPPTAKSPAARA